MEFEYGKPISEKLSEALKEHITATDRTELANEDTGASTLRNLMYRTTTVSEKNYIGVEKLIKRALENCKKTNTKFVSQKEVLMKAKQNKISA